MTGVKKQHTVKLKKRLLDIRSEMQHSLDKVCLGHMTIDEWNQFSEKFGQEYNEIAKQLEQLEGIRTND